MVALNADVVGAAPPTARYLIETGVVVLGDQVRVHATVMDVTT